MFTLWKFSFEKDPCSIPNIVVPILGDIVYVFLKGEIVIQTHRLKSDFTYTNA